jgi:putative ABC transport system ATP-binding protein
MNDPIIVVDKLRVIYNQGKSNETRALEETNLTIYPHEYVIIYGPSGCGKSTLLYSISGLQSPTYGDVSIAGTSIAKMTRAEELELHQTKIGMIFQAFYLISSLDILENICLPKVFQESLRANGKPPASSSCAASASSNKPTNSQVSSPEDKNSVSPSRVRSSTIRKSSSPTNP